MYDAVLQGNSRASEDEMCEALPRGCEEGFWSGLITGQIAGPGMVLGCMGRMHNVSCMLQTVVAWHFVRAHPYSGYLSLECRGHVFAAFSKAMTCMLRPC
jgi:hypothetical protein